MASLVAIGGLPPARLCPKGDLRSAPNRRMELLSLFSGGLQPELECTLYTDSVTVQSAACYTLCNRAEHCSVWCALCIVQLTLGCSQQHFLILLLNTLVNSKQCTGTYGSCSSFRLLAKLFGSVPTAVPSFFHCAFQC